MTDQYAVIGNPVAHSKSPRIHTLFARQTQQDMHYSTLLAPLDQFQTAVRDFFVQEQGKGLNVTVPFKQEAWQLCNEHSDYALHSGAVNTLLYRDDGSIWGANTDGLGLVRDLQQNHAIALHDKKILVLGAGGAVRGVLQPILEQYPQQVFIANRTTARAHELVTLFGQFDVLDGGGYGDIPKTGFDIIINGTSASLQGDLPPVPAHCVVDAECCYDMMYSSESASTAFVQWALSHHVPRALDGLGMLVEQAAESFFIWRGVRPETHTVLSVLRAREPQI